MSYSRDLFLYIKSITVVSCVNLILKNRDISNIIIDSGYLILSSFIKNRICFQCHNKEYLQIDYQRLVLR